MTQFLKKNSIWIFGGGVIILLPQIFSSGFAISVMGLMGIMIIFALAYNMLLGQGGMLSFGHAVYFGLAGYFTIHLLNLMGDGAIGYFPVSLLPLFGGLVGLFFGVLIGFVSTRRAGTIFALISLGFVEMMTAMAFILITFFNGEEGIQGDRWVGPEPLGITYGPGIQVYYLIGAWCLFSMIAMYALTKTPFGRMSNAVRDNPERAQFVGYNTQRVRWLAFSLSSFFAGIAGALFALHFEHVGYEAASMELSGEIFAPTGIAGLILRHEPVWKSDFRLLGKMVLPYLSALISILLAASGIIALIEMINHVADEYSEGSIISVYGIALETTSFMPWLVCIIVALIGIGLCRLSFPYVTRNWDGIMNTIKERMTQ
jgi:branched-chain amino acid transport system permease protein